jgi:hypothetical protein
MGQSLASGHWSPWPGKPGSISSSAATSLVLKRISILDFEKHFYLTPVGSNSKISLAKLAAVMKLFIL